jgi:hypothetical protein
VVGRCEGDFGNDHLGRLSSYKDETRTSLQWPALWSPLIFRHVIGVLWVFLTVQDNDVQGKIACNR